MWKPPYIWKQNRNKNFTLGGVHKGRHLQGGREGVAKWWHYSISHYSEKSDKRGGRGQKSQNGGDVIYGRPLTKNPLRRNIVSHLFGNLLSGFREVFGWCIIIIILVWLYTYQMTCACFLNKYLHTINLQHIIMCFLAYFQMHILCLAPLLHLHSLNLGIEVY